MALTISNSKYKIASTKDQARSRKVCSLCPLIREHATLSVGYPFGRISAQSKCSSLDPTGNELGPIRCQSSAQISGETPKFDRQRRSLYADFGPLLRIMAPNSIIFFTNGSKVDINLIRFDSRSTFALISCRRLSMVDTEIEKFFVVFLLLIAGLFVGTCFNSTYVAHSLFIRTSTFSPYCSLQQLEYTG